MEKLLGWILAFLGALYISVAIACLLLDLFIALMTFKPWEDKESRGEFSKELGKIVARVMLWPIVIIFGVKDE